MSSRAVGRRVRWLPVAFAVLLAGARTRAAAPLAAATIEEHLGAPVPASLTFTGEDGRPVSLSSLVGGKPLVISLAYFSCPMLCPLGQDGAADAFRDSGWELGRDFRAVTISIDPHDTPAVASEWQSRVAARLHRPASDLDWHFLTGDEPSIRKIADAVGFHYAYDPATAQYSHAAALFVVGVDGRLSRYIYGITFTGRDMADALAAARDGRRLASRESFLLRCFHYVPALRQHGGFVVWLLRLGGLGVTATIASALFLLWRREVRA